MMAFLFGIFHTWLVLVAAPLITGIVRLTKARLQGRQGASPLQPYRDLWRLLQKESVIAETASWLFRIAPYLVFVAVWLAATIMPTFTTDMILTPAADLIALVALLGTARFFTALAGLDAGTAFGGLGSSREMFVASIGEPAMLMVIFSLSLLTHTTSPANMIAYVLSGHIGIEVSAGLALASMVMVAIAENGRIPIDNPTTHLELTMIHEAMVLEYSGRHLALLEAAAMVRLLLFMTIISSLFFPWGIAFVDAGPGEVLLGLLAWFAKVSVLAMVLGFCESLVAKMRVFQIADFLGGALLLALLATIFLYVSEAV
ncbi:NADH-quinone oxidoreductase subunit H [Telmatospirillum sp.]|uniref:respiratory chain complex I subunit 1 family protein n=1 Tax=Telmatospirillum sp. TaxID=2079197 RepID=UPI00284B6E04|nr:NADH-quinone oxidoreductase subunit H [Telmatospirillum sp.]MDR3438552.1 NADH-quinone oxidoreductase subunit H [Telmatospirillum sp.]